VESREPEAGAVMTTAEFLSTPVSNRVHELWHGVVRVAESPTSWHQNLAFETVPSRVLPHLALRLADLSD
jgi:hypothetical protein